MKNTIEFPAMPWQGVDEVLRLWAGRGQLYTALAAISDSDHPNDNWQPRDIERRGHRVLFEQAVPLIARLPATRSGWLEAIPASTVRQRALAKAPYGSVDWTATRRLGWPPERFAIRYRTRAHDEMLLSCLRWALETLRPVHRDAVKTVPTLDLSVRRNVSIALGLLEMSPVDHAAGIQPTVQELSAMRTAGRPWRTLGELCRLLVRSRSKLQDIARSQIYPDLELRSRLFHLGVLGAMLRGLRESGVKTTSVRPIAGGSTGPAFAATDARGQSWDLWVEAAGMWTYYGLSSPYRKAVSGLPGAGQPLGADIALICPGKRAVLIECKYSSSPEYVGRNGYLQAVTYLTEARSGLASNAESIVIGPDGVIGSTGTAETVLGKVSVAPVSELAGLIRSFLDG